MATVGHDLEKHKQSHKELCMQMHKSWQWQVANHLLTSECETSSIQSLVAAEGAV